MTLLRYVTKLGLQPDRLQVTRPHKQSARMWHHERGRERATSHAGRAGLILRRRVLSKCRRRVRAVVLDRLPQGARMAPCAAASLLCFLGRMLLVLCCQPVTDATALPTSVTSSA